MKVFYFTGTGNSLAVAKAIGGEAISIPQVINDEDLSFTDDAIGIVFPLYWMTAPKMVREFIDRAQLQADYRFAIATYGNFAGSGVADVQSRASKQGWSFDYTATLLMVDNYLPLFEIDDQIAKLPSKGTDAALQAIVGDIAARKSSLFKASLNDKFLTKATAGGLKKMERGTIARTFSVDENCTHCGTCAQVCPKGNVVVGDAGVAFGMNCASCYACIHNCPVAAIHMSDEQSAVRWRNPSVTVAEIIAANRQPRPDPSALEVADALAAAAKADAVEEAAAPAEQA